MRKNADAPVDLRRSWFHSLAKNGNMSEDKTAPPQRISVLSKEFTSAAMEFHRRNMAAKGYRLDGAIRRHKLMITDGMGEPQDLLGGETYYVVTFVQEKE